MTEYFPSLRSCLLLALLMFFASFVAKFRSTTLRRGIPMDLKEFIGRALADIVQGVLDAQQTLGTNGKYINPELSTQQGTHEKHGKLVSIQGQLVQSVEFDVAVTATEGTGTKGGIGVVAGVFALGSQGQSAAETSAVSRIKFSVPVALPYGEKMHG